MRISSPYFLSSFREAKQEKGAAVWSKPLPPPLFVYSFKIIPKHIPVSMGFGLKAFGDPPETRTRDTLLKRQVLCRLS